MLYLPTLEEYPFVNFEEDLKKTIPKGGFTITHKGS